MASRATLTDTDVLSLLNKWRARIRCCGQGGVAYQVDELQRHKSKTSVGENFEHRTIARVSPDRNITTKSHRVIMQINELKLALQNPEVDRHRQKLFVLLLFLKKIQAAKNTWRAITDTSVVLSGCSHIIQAPRVMRKWRFSQPPLYSSPLELRTLYCVLNV